MIFIFYGNDTIGVRKKALDFLHTKEEEGSEVVSVTSENYTEGVLHELAGATSLFGPRQIVLIDTLSGEEEYFAALLEMVPELSASTNIFVVIEGPLLAAQKKLFLEHVADMIEVKKAEAERFNSFALADALVIRDKKNLWIGLTAAWRAGLSNEEILGTLYWQVKMLRLASVTNSPEEAGQKPFVYNKAKRALVRFTPQELTRLSRELLAIYHDGHMGKRDIDTALEQWVLAL